MYIHIFMYIYAWYVYMYIYAWCMHVWCTFGDQRTNFRSWLCPSTLGFYGLNSGCWVLCLGRKYPYLLSHLATLLLLNKMVHIVNIIMETQLNPVFWERKQTVISDLLNPGLKFASCSSTERRRWTWVPPLPKKLSATPTCLQRKKWIQAGS